MDPAAAALLDRSRVATLATVLADGRPHLVPVVFALDGVDVVTSVDGKPKTGKVLARIENIARDPRVTLLAHHYEEDWSRLAWVRVDGNASVEDGGESFARALKSLRDRYPQYESVDLTGPVIRISVESTATWEATPR
ncbi:MAG TPA: TIGR03668 family PPOX class F420-dependent oxidoreductase [Acidimicrobiia bacterium]|nr:TIGR03668 family PPOX class F420-dependent oxidoreductase [Acidimicrobiia bacterium]